MVKRLELDRTTKQTRAFGLSFFYWIGAQNKTNETYGTNRTNECALKSKSPINLIGLISPIGLIFTP